MAVDSRDKRFSLIGFAAPVPFNTPDPDGDIETADRAMLLALYAGIELSAVADAVWTAVSKASTSWSDVAAASGVWTDATKASTTWTDQ